MRKQYLVLTMILGLSLALFACAGNQNTAANNDGMVENNPSNNPVEVATEEPVATEALAPTDQPATEESTVSENAETYTLVAGESEARFKIQEVLSGSDKLVIGVTNAVSGTIMVDLTSPSAVSMSVIEINLEDIKTDNSFRTNTVHVAILQTGTYPTTTFEPLEYIGLPESVAVGDSFDFQIRGNLTIKATTREEVFDVSVTIVSESRIEGFASVTISHDAYGASVLRLPSQVSSVNNVTVLELQFVAEK